VPDIEQYREWEIWSGLLSEAPDAEVGVLGIPFDGAVSFRPGAAMAPSRMRELSDRMSDCSEEGHALHLRVRDYGDVPPEQDQEQYFQTVEQWAFPVLQHPLALFLGGDHSVTIPLMRAFARAAPGSFGVLHIDAHPDLFDLYQGSRLSHACTARRALELKGLESEHLVFVGLNSFAPPERKFLAANPEIPVFTARDCYKQGVEAVAERLVQQLAGLDSIYVTLDIDVLDAAHAPGTGYPEGVGLSTRDLMELMRAVVLTLPVKAMDLVEVAPPLDHSDITTFAALKVIYEVWWAFQARH
jgi:agmatinase